MRRVGQAGRELLRQRRAPAAAARPPGVQLARRGAAGHAHDLGDGHHAAGAVGRAGLADHEVERVGDLLAQGGVREPEVGHQGERLDAPQRLGRRAGVDRAERAVVAGGQRGQHVERLRAAHLADHDPVGPHPQRVAHQPPDRDLAAALEVRRARLEPDDVRLAQPQLGGVLDRDHPLPRADEARQHVQRRRLAGAGAAADEDARAGAHRAREEVEQRAGERAVGDQLVGAEPAAAEAADRQHRAVERERRDHDVHARAVGQPCVAQRLGLVDAPPERRQDALDRVAQVALAREPHRRALEPAAALDPHRLGPARPSAPRPPGSPSSGSSGPSPNARSAIRPASSARVAASSTAASRSTSARMRAVRSRSGSPPSAARRSRRSPARVSRSSPTSAIGRAREISPRQAGARPPVDARSPGARTSRRISVAYVAAAAR